MIFAKLEAGDTDDDVGVSKIQKGVKKFWNTLNCVNGIA